MIRPGLTIREGLSQVGEPLHWVRWAIDREDQYAQLLKEVRKITDELWRDNMIEQGQCGFRVVDSDDSLTKIMQDKRGELEKMLRGMLPSNIYLFAKLREVVMNALMHGFNYADNGVVDVRGIVGTEGECWVVDQPLNGPDLSVAKQRFELGESLNYNTELGEKRGAGMMCFASDMYPGDVWFEQLQDGYRTILADINEHGRYMRLTEEEKLKIKKRKWNNIMRKLYYYDDCGLEDPRKFYKDYFKKSEVSFFDEVLPVLDHNRLEEYHILLVGYLSMMSLEPEGSTLFKEVLIDLDEKWFDLYLRILVDIEDQAAIDLFKVVLKKLRNIDVESIIHEKKEGLRR